MNHHVNTILDGRLVNAETAHDEPAGQRRRMELESEQTELNQYLREENSRELETMLRDDAGSSDRIAPLQPVQYRYQFTVSPCPGGQCNVCI